MYRIPKVLGQKLLQLKLEAQDRMTDLRAEIDKLNEVMRTLEDVVGDIHIHALDHFNDKSEKWQDSDAGHDFLAWLEEVERLKDAAGDEFEIDDPEWLELLDDLNEPPRA